MSSFIYFAVAAIFLYVTVDFAVRAWRLPAKRWSSPDRAGQLVGLLTVVATFVLARALLVAPGIDTIIWLVATAITAAGAFGAVQTWTRRPWLADRKPRRRLASLSFNAVLAIAVIWLFV